MPSVMIAFQEYPAIRSKTDNAFAQGVFTSCNALKEIHLALTEIDNVGYIFSDSIVNNATLYVPATKLDDYKKHRHFGLFKTIIPE